MGGHTKSGLLCDTLVALKDELQRITNPKYQKLISELEKHPYNPDLEENDLPNTDRLAKALGFKKARVQLLLKGLHTELLNNFMMKPLEIKNVRHCICVNFPFEGIRKISK